MTISSTKADAAAEPIATTARGRLLGTRNGRLLVFHAIPYAIAERFRPPKPVPVWSGIRSAIQPGPVCPQLPSRLEIVMGPRKQGREMSEDCQILSVFSPDLNGKRPVMVWIHGGAYVSGGGEEAWYDASRLADEGDVVAVTVSYRHGAFGYLHTNEFGAPNAGLQDQKAALAWVRDNIASFGGDPNNVTVFGQSAGGHSIASLLASAEPALFRRAILQSAPIGSDMNEADAQAIGRQFREVLGRSAVSATVEEILAAQKTVLAKSERGMTFEPVGIDTTRPAATRADKPDILITYTRDDAAPFVQLRREEKQFGGLIDDAATLAVTRITFSGPSKALASRLRKTGYQVSVCEINWRPKGSAYGACHCIELPLLLGTDEAWQGAPMLGTAASEQVQRGRCGHVSRTPASLHILQSGYGTKIKRLPFF
jgi:para-nitrobenzyl esterase